MNTQLYTNTGIGTLFYFPKQLPTYTARQFYAKGGIATLVPRQHLFLGGVGKAITGGIGSLLGGVGDVGSAIVGGIGSAVGGLGDVLKSPIAQFALPFAAAALGIPPWAVPIANYAVTGKINPLSVVAAALPGLQFAEGAEGLSLPTGWDSGIEGINIGTQGDSLSNMITNQAKNLFSGAPGDPLSNINTLQGVGGDLNNTITQNYLTANDAYSGTSLGTDFNKFTPQNVSTDAGITSIFNPDQETGLNIPVDEAGGNIPDLREQILSGRVPVDTAKPGYFKNTFENLKTAFSPNTLTTSERLSALSDIGSDTFNAIYKNKDGSYNMSAVIGTLVMLPTYAQAKAKADELGVPFDEATYQQNQVSAPKQRYAELAPKSSFGLKDGGRIGFQVGGMSNNRISQIIQLIRDAESVGDMEKANELRLDLYRETKKADGGRIGHKDGKLVLDEGPANKATRLQMEKAAKEAQKRYAKIKADEKLMDKNYNEQSMYDFKKTQKELFDMAPEEGYAPLPEPIKPEGVLSIKLTPTDNKIIPRENRSLGGMLGKILSTDVNAAPVNVSGNMSSLIKQIIGVVSPVANPSQNTKQPYIPTDRPVNDLYKYYLNQENDEEKRKQIMNKVNPLFGIGKAYGGMIDHPVRMLHGGIPELDLRAKGGFIPVGVKERADDVPAMLSKNEFVFTADAVRNAGNGSINKGAQKMYKLMKSLENKKIKKKVD